MVMTRDQVRVLTGGCTLLPGPEPFNNPARGTTETSETHFASSDYIARRVLTIHTLTQTTDRRDLSLYPDTELVTERIITTQTLTRTPGRTRNRTDTTQTFTRQHPTGHTIDCRHSDCLIRHPTGCAVHHRP